MSVAVIVGRGILSMLPGAVCGDTLYEKESNRRGR